MKRRLPFLFLFVVLFNLMGYFLLFGGLELKAKKYAQELIGQPGLSFQPTIIAFAKLNTTQTSQKGITTSTKEFRWNGAMYDVLKKVVTSDSVLFYCFEDTNETELISCFLQYLSQNTATGQQEQANFSLKKIVNFYFEGTPRFFPYLGASEFRYTNYFFGYLQTFTLPATQPPDLC